MRPSGPARAAARPLSFAEALLNEIEPGFNTLCAGGAADLGFARRRRPRGRIYMHYTVLGPCRSFIITMIFHLIVVVIHITMHNGSIVFMTSNIILMIIVFTILH